MEDSEINEKRISRKSFLTYTASIALTAGFVPACLRYSSSDTNQSLVRLDRENLLIYQDEDGDIRLVQSRNDWIRRRETILKNMQVVMGTLPGHERIVPLDLQVDWEVDEGSYVIRLISYVADAGERVPAYLLIPKEALQPSVQIPAILSPLGTTQSRSTFSKAAMEEDGFPLWNDHRDWPRELAKRGYVTLVPSYPLLGEYQPDLKELGYESGTMKAIWNNMRGLDLLDELSFVRNGSYGSIGHSLGGHNSIYTAVFDKRIKVVITSCGFDSYLDYKDGDIRGWTQELYMPKIEEYALEEIPFDFHEMIAALAPRVFYANAPLNDDNFKWDSAASIVKTAMQIYNLYDVSERLQIEHPNAGHVFPEKQRKKAYLLFDRYLM